jgi:SAM-dependent methyltransferase
MNASGKLFDLFLAHDGKAIDKWEQYLGVYQSELAGLIAVGKPLRLLEIGVQNGGSLELWHKFLPPGSQIRGLDIDPRVASLTFDHGTTRADVADATNAQHLEEILGAETFDIIIDDGSHVCGDVIRTFEILFDRVAPGGRYIVEDLHCSYYPGHGGGLKSAESSIEHLKSLIDSLHADHLQPGESNPTERDKLSQYNRWVARVAFYDSIAIIEKLPSAKTSPYRRMLSGDEAALQPASNWVHATPTASLQTLLFGHAAMPQFEQALFKELEARRLEVANLVAAMATQSSELDRLRTTLEQLIQKNGQA